MESLWLISPPVTSNRVVGGGAHRLVKSQALAPKHSTRAPCGSQAEQCQQGGDIGQEGHGQLPPTPGQKPVILSPCHYQIHTFSNPLVSCLSEAILLGY